MNRARLEKLAKWLENGAVHAHVQFCMLTGIKVMRPAKFDPDAPTSCATACCVAGAALQFFAPDETAKLMRKEFYGSDEWIDEVPFTWVSASAKRLLGLTGKQAADLFTPDVQAERKTGKRVELYVFNDPLWAAATIRHLLRTGEADWDASKPRPSA